MTRTAANNSRSTRDEYEDYELDNGTKQKPKGKQQEPLSQDLEAKAYRFTRDTQLILAGATARANAFKFCKPCPIRVLDISNKTKQCPKPLPSKHCKN